MQDHISKGQGSPTQNSQIANVSSKSKGFHILELHTPTLESCMGFVLTVTGITAGVSQILQAAVGGQTPTRVRQGSPNQHLHSTSTQQAPSVAPSPSYLFDMGPRENPDPPANVRPGASYVASRGPSELQAVCSEAHQVPMGGRHVTKVLRIPPQPGSQQSVVYTASREREG